jgi:hypothetical protein
VIRSGVTGTIFVIFRQLTDDLLIKAQEDPTDTSLATARTRYYSFLDFGALAGSTGLANGTVKIRDLFGGFTFGGILFLGFLGRLLTLAFIFYAGRGHRGNRKVVGGARAGSIRVAGITSLINSAIGSCALGTSIYHNNKKRTE